MSAFTEFDFETGNKVIGGKIKKFKGEAGRSYRSSFAFWGKTPEGTLDLEGKTPKFVGAKRYYFEGVGYVIANNPEFQKLAGGENPRMSIATVLVIWPTNSSGQIDKGRLASGDYEVMPWIISEDKYRSFAPIHNEFPFGEHDLTISCTDAQFQKMTFSPTKDSLLRMIRDKKPEIFSEISEQVFRVADTLNSLIGREMSLDQLREKLGLGAPAGATGGTATPEIDDIIDDILD